MIIIRHGETEENIKGISQGQTHGKLTANGKNSARRLALSLKKEKIDIIFSSDLKRVVYTTRQILKFHKVPIYYVKDLRERNMSSFQGKKRELLHEAQAKSGLSHTKFRPRGGESLIDVKNRTKRFLDKLSKKYKDKTILLSTHGGVIRCIISIYFGIPLEETRKILPKNSGMLILDVQKSKVNKLKDTMFVQ